MQLDERAEIAVLSRGIVIQGTDGDIGCRVLLTAASTAVLQGVELSGCGQQVYSSPALHIVGVDHAEVLNCSFVGSKAQGVGAINTTRLRLEHNAIINSNGSSVVIVGSTDARSNVYSFQRKET